MTKQVFKGAIYGQVAGGDIINNHIERIEILGEAHLHMPAPVRLQTKVVVPHGPQHISDDQAALLSRLVREIVELEKRQKQKPKGFQAVWLGVNAHCRVTQYRLIPAESFEKAEKYLRQWIGRLNSMASAPVADNDAWRKRRYAYIKINTKGDEGSAWLATYLTRTFGKTTLTDLDDPGLDRTYRAVASRKRNIARMVVAR